MNQNNNKVGKRWRGLSKKVTSAILLSAVGLSAVAQSNDGQDNPSQLNVSFGAQLGDDTGITTAVDLAILRQTRTQTLAFDLSGRVTAFEADDYDLILTDPRARLSYSVEGSPISLNAALSYGQSRVDGVTSQAELADGLSESDFVDDTGTRVDVSGRVAAEFGARAPFGATVELGFSDTTYRDTTSTELVDRESRFATVSLRMDVTPVFQVGPTYSISRAEFADADETVQVRQTLGVKLTYQLNPVTTLDGVLNWSEIETTETVATTTGAGGRVTTAVEGAGIDIGATILQRNGQMRFGYQRSLLASGNFDRLSFSRQHALSPVQKISYGVGVVRYGEGGTGFTGNLDFEQDLRNGTLGFSFSQNVSETEQNEIAVARQVGARYSTALTTVGTLEASANWSSFERPEASGSDYSSVNLSVGYRHQLTRDWFAGVRVDHAVVNEDDRETNARTNLSLSINRTISLSR